MQSCTSILLCWQSITQRAAVVDLNFVGFPQKGNKKQNFLPSGKVYATDGQINIARLATTCHQQT